MKKKLIIAVFALCASLTVAAQVPGYMGRRFSVGYAADLWPSMLNPSGYTTSKGDAGLNYMHGLNIEYDIKKRTALCFGLQYFRTGLKSNKIYQGDLRTQQYGYQEYADFVYRRPDGIPVQLYTTGISLGIKFFRHGFLAPVGKYNKFDFTLLLNHASYQTDAFYYVEYKTPAPLGTGLVKSKGCSFGYTLGRQRVIADKFVLDYGMRFAFTPSLLFSDASNGRDTEMVMKEYISEREFFEQLINVHLAINFLAF